MNYNISALERRLQSIYVEITSKCNFQCIYCYNDSGKNNPKKSINLVSFNKILNAAYKLCAEEITLSGGEPLLNSEWPVMLEEISKKGMRARLITNGSLITECVVDELKKTYPIIQVTLDSCDELVNDKYKGKGSYASICHGLDMLHQYYDMEYVVLRCNLNYDNMSAEQVKGIVHFLKNKGVKYIHYSMIISEGRAQEWTFPNLQMNFKELEEFASYANKLERELLEEGIRLTGPTTSACHACPYTCHQKYKGLFNLYISYNGDIFPCQSLTTEEFRLGSIEYDTIEDAYMGEKMQIFLRKANTRLNEMVECKNCLFERICGKGCIAECIKNESFYSTDGNCSHRIRELKSMIRRAALGKAAGN